MPVNPLDLIGNTPLVKLNNISPEGVEIYAKMESENLTGSIKARPALNMVLQAEKSGRLKPGMKLLEATSGNTGIALAAIAGLRGYSFTAVVSKAVTEERIELLKAYGAEIIFTSAEGGSNQAIAHAHQIVDQDKSYLMLDQYDNQANPDAHYYGTAPEIIKELPEITTLVAGLGTGGTLMGCSKRLREHNSDIQIVGAEPMPGESVQGLRSLDDGYIPPIFNLEVLDRKLLISSRDSIYWAIMLLRKEGLFCGVSAGSNLAAALKVASPENNQIVIIVPDGGARYLSTGIFSASEDELDNFDAYGWW
jgi:cysteine synthase B